MTCRHCGAELLPTDGACPSCERATAFTHATPGSTAVDALDAITDAGMSGTATFSQGFAPTVIPSPDQAPTTVPADEDATVAVSSGTGASRARKPHGPLGIGQAFGPRYHVIKILGVGGMGAVYQAWDNELGVAVAVKVIRPEIAADPVAARDIERRFKRELLLARQVTHNNVVRIHDLGEIDGIKYITMPYVEGSDLATVLHHEQKLPIRRALKIARGVVSGLSAAHAAGVVHRDLKPANIMVDAEDRPTIMDFGIALSAGAADRGGANEGSWPRSVDHATSLTARHTMAGAIVGTVRYMAPEQARGDEVDQRADIYAFGLILYDMLLGGQRAQSAASPMEELQARVQRVPRSPRAIDPTIGKELDAIITGCLEPDAAKRLQTSVEVQSALDTLDDDGKRLPIIRRVSLRTLAATVLLSLGALVGTWYYASRFAPPVEHEAVSVLITNFDNRTNDEVFTGALEHALTVDVEGASFVSTFDRFEARRIAARLRPGGSFDEAAGRLVAEREGIKVVLAGSVAPAGTGYTIAVRGIDPASNEELWTTNAVAKTKAEALTALGTVAAEVRKRLGDTASLNERMSAARVVASRSLDALRSYSLAQDLYLSGKVEEAVSYYQRAVEQDASFGRAYANWGLASYALGRNDEAEALWKKALALADNMTEREKYSTLGSYYNTMARNYEKAIENYETLTKLYPSDARAQNNLAIAYFKVRNFAKAMEQGRKAVELYPRNVTRRVNFGLYAMYAGDFEAAAKQAAEIEKESPGTYINYLPLAVAAIMRGDYTAARGAYDRMAQTGVQGASFAAGGLADLALFQGQYSEAESILEAGIAADRDAKRAARLAAKLIALAELYEITGRGPLALQTIREALELGRDESVLVPSALLFLRARQSTTAEEIAADLDNQLQTQTRAYAKIIDGKIASLRRRRASAIDAFRESIKLADPWLARFEMGITYVEAEHYAEAITELEACLKRRGEATALFLDDVPTIRYLAALPYWLARAQEGLGQQAAATANYRAFLEPRAGNPNNPLVRDARKKLGL